MTRNPAWKRLDLSKFERTKFPVKTCTIRNADDKDVMDSKAVFLCILADRRFPDQFEGRCLHPYIWKSKRGKSYYGWVDEWGNLFDHCTHSIHEHWDDQVVAWKRIPTPTRKRN